MSDDARVWVVDRIVGDRVVLVVDDTGASTQIERGALPPPVHEGDVLRVPQAADGEPDWSRALPDMALRRERLQAAQRVLDRLKKRDPGGDVKL